MNTTRHLQPLAGPRQDRLPSSFRSVAHASARIASLIPIAVIAAGCATQYRFGVEAINQTHDAVAPQSYRLVDARPDVAAGDPVFKQVTRDVETALSSKGLYAAPPGVTPDLMIEVDYGISAPIVTQHVRTEPVYIMASRAPSLSLSQGDTSMRSVAAPTFFANQDVPFTVTTYEKFLRLTAREGKPSASAPRARQVWSVYVSNDDKSDNLGRYLRLMIAAAMDNIGRDFGTERRIVLTKGDGRVVFVEQGMEQT